MEEALVKPTEPLICSLGAAAVLAMRRTPPVPPARENARRTPVCINGCTGSTCAQCYQSSVISHLSTTVVLTLCYTVHCLQCGVSPSPRPGVSATTRAHSCSILLSLLRRLRLNALDHLQQTRHSIAAARATSSGQQQLLGCSQTHTRTHQTHTHLLYCGWVLGLWRAEALNGRLHCKGNGEACCTHAIVEAAQDSQSGVGVRGRQRGWFDCPAEFHPASASPAAVQ